jgi:hypothetical protein
VFSRPQQVLDAPALQDDFYLNLVDWSAQNVLAVGLGTRIAGHVVVPALKDSKLESLSQAALLPLLQPQTQLPRVARCSC